MSETVHCCPILIVSPDTSHPHVPDAAPLLRFYEVFQPGRARIVSAQDLLEGPSWQVDTLFIGVPSLLSPAHMARVRARKAVLFDYFDSPHATWFDSDQAFLCSLTRLYLKTTLVDGVELGHGLRKGLLPMALPLRIGRALRIRKWLNPLVEGWRALLKRERHWDLSLLGHATYLDEYDAQGQRLRYHQRIHWMREVRQHSKWRFWGGLYPLSYVPLSTIEADCGPLGDLFGHARRIDRHLYLARMAQTRVALCPSGHARWTYRHLEAIYCGCEVVSCDLSNVHTLPRLPKEYFYQVPDHAPIAAHVDHALAERPVNAERRRAALAAMEAQLNGGLYSRNRPQVFETFIAQLGD
jgi:hypothetical protein